LTDFYVFVKTEISLQSSYDSMFLMLEPNIKYSQTCIQQSPLGQRKNDGTRQMTYIKTYSQTCIQQSPLEQRKNDGTRQMTAYLR